MRTLFNPKLIEFAQELPRPLYAVGGVVRNYLIDKSLSLDVDLASDIPMDEMIWYCQKSGLEVLATYKRTGTVNFTDGKTKYEYTAFRKEKYIGGEHTPYQTEPTSDIKEDAERRDFKCNAVYYDIKNGRFVDPLSGMEDIKRRVIDTVVDASEVFSHDGLRLMRLARFSAELNFTIENSVLNSARANASNIKEISAERILKELKLILSADQKYPFSGSDAHYRGLKVLDEIRVLDHILPELTLGRGMEQRADYHDHDVLEHSLRCVKYSDKSVRLVALLHDIGKPYCMIKEGKYHNHYSAGEKIAVEVLKRLKADTSTIKETAFLTAFHMLDMDLMMKESKVRVFIAKNFPLVDKLLMLKQADYSACKDKFDECKTVQKWKEVIEKMKAEHTPFTRKQLEISAKDLTEIGYSGKRIGEELDKLWKDCVIDPKQNAKEKLLVVAVRDFRGKAKTKKA